jgi:hypothetical protein
VYAAPDWIDLGAPGLRFGPSIQALAKNTGESTKQVTVTFDEPAKLSAAWPSASCTTTGATTSCVTDAPLKPGDRFYLRVKLRDWADDEDRSHWSSRKVTVTASLGTAAASTLVKLPWWSWPVLPDHKPIQKPTATTTTTKPVTTTPSNTPTTTTKPTVTMTTTPPPPPTSTKPPGQPCDTMSGVERLIAILTGRCPTPDGPAPR